VSNTQLQSQYANNKIANIDKKKHSRLVPIKKPEAQPFLAVKLSINTTYQGSPDNVTINQHTA
jgi:hypothetical protein